MGAHLLLAEDDADNRLMVTKYLEAKGYRVTAVGDGQAVFDAMARHADIDLLVLDHMMPQKTGYEVLTTLRSAGNFIPIILATAVAQPAAIEQALEDGADDYVTKPFALNVLAARIAARLRNRSRPPQAAPQPIPPSLPDDAVDDVEIIEESDVAFAELDIELPPIEVSSKTLPKGTVVAERYKVQNLIGEGGYGVVVRARHLDLEQDVAIKVLRGPFSKKDVEKFRKEAQMACRVRHENAVRILDFGVLKEGAPYLVMENLEGPTLESVLDSGKVTIDRGAPILQAVLAGLAACHRQKLVHCDVKPSNIVLCREDQREVVKLLDFGIATEMRHAKDSKTIAGSASYLAPERLAGERFDGRADVYAVGIMLYRMVLGRFPFDPDNPDAAIKWHLDGARVAPSTLVPGISRAVDRAVLALLARDPMKRPHAEEAETLMATLIWDA